jgi:hypothetical protein
MLFLGLEAEGNADAVDDNDSTSPSPTTTTQKPPDFTTAAVVEAARAICECSGRDTCDHPPGLCRRLKQPAASVMASTDPPLLPLSEFATIKPKESKKSRKGSSTWDAVLAADAAAREQAESMSEETPQQQQRGGFVASGYEEFDSLHVGVITGHLSRTIDGPREPKLCKFLRFDENSDEIR